MTTLPPPEGGADPHRDDWKPVPLLAKVYDRETKVYYIEFEAPKQLLLNPQYSAMVHDELLRNADRDGLMIEGQVVITERDKGTQAPDPTTERDATVQEVLKDPAKEADVEIEQDKIESPYKMSDAEIAYRKRMRESMRQTGLESLGFVQRELDGKPLPDGRRFTVDREAFLDGFFGGTGPVRKPEVMIVRAEALVAMSLGTTDAEVTERLMREEPPKEEIDVEKEMLGIEIPDDLSGLDDA